MLHADHGSHEQSFLTSRLLFSAPTILDECGPCIQRCQHRAFLSPSSVLNDDTATQLGRPSARSPRLDWDGQLCTLPMEYGAAHVT